MRIIGTTTVAAHARVSVCWKARAGPTRGYASLALEKCMKLRSVLLSALPVLGLVACGSSATTQPAGGAGTTSSASGGSGGSGGAEPGCPAGLLACGTACVDAKHDPANCGTCGNACAAGEVCSGGQCGLSCSGGSTHCGSQCVNTQLDPANCGSCGHACGFSEVCSAGQCGLACMGGTTLCDAACADTQVDPAHCGDCATQCAAGEVCSAGQCGLSCVGGSTLCDAACVDTQVDPAHCGDCATQCGAGEVCSAGQCGLSCVGGSTLCDAACVDTQVDPAHCGDCATPCAAGESCVAGLCGIACTGGTSLCDGACVDYQKDPLHCGGCSTTCASSEACVGGGCVPHPVSCAAILAASLGAPSGVYTLDPDGAGPQAPFQAVCEMTTDGGGWTLVASLVNDGIASWTQIRSGASSLGNWRSSNTFGDVGTYQTADYKSLAFSRLAANDVLMVDDGGNWARFATVLSSKTLLARILETTACTTAPVLAPGSANIASSSDAALPFLMFGFYGGDPNSAGSCAFNNSPDASDSSVLYVLGSGCGSAGLGHVGWYDGANNWDHDAYFCLKTAPSPATSCGNYYGSGVTGWPSCVSSAAFLYVR
jgi:hypothetical protein